MNVRQRYIIEGTHAAAATDQNSKYHFEYYLCVLQWQTTTSARLIVLGASARFLVRFLVCVRMRAFR